MQDKELLQHYRMISIDRPGFGFSDFGKPVHLSAQSSLISPVIKKINNGKPVYLAGHSLGGPLIIKLAADFPGYYDGLVMLAGSAFVPLEFNKHAFVSEGACYDATVYLTNASFMDAPQENESVH